MSIKVKYFATLREEMQCGEKDIEATGLHSVADVWHHATDGRDLPPNTLAAVNLEYASFTQPVRDGDEVAFFPPVTGG